jgi:hypothetical protein
MPSHWIGRLENSFLHILPSRYHLEVTKCSSLQ